MKAKLMFWPVLFMVVGLLVGMLGTGHAAAASPSADTLPTYKEPSSARFDLSGYVKVGSSNEDTINLPISGGGALSGKNLQEDVTVDLSGLVAGAGVNPIPGQQAALTTSIIVLDGKIYFKTSGLGTPQEKWTEVDADSAGALSGMFGSNLTGFDPKYAEAFTVTQVGKDTVNGAATTKYHVAVDYQKLLALVSPSGTPPELADTQTTFNLTFDLWIGSSDQYIHKVALALSGSTTAQGTTTSIEMSLTIVYKEFDVPVTITAPTNVEKLDLSQSGLGSGVGMLPIGGLLGGVPGSMSTGVGMGMPSVNKPMAGMPKTGAGAGGGAPLIIVAAALGLLCIALGGAVRRKTP